MTRRGKPVGPWRLSARRALADFPAPTPQSTPCRLWQGPTNKGGYGLRADGSFVHRWVWEQIHGSFVHRWVWEQIHGALAAGRRVLHHCDQPLCYRYSHLFEGTQGDNVADMIAKGRDRKASPRGTANAASKLTEDDVRAIRTAIAEGQSRQEIAERFGIHVMTVSKIATGKRWGWLS